MEKKVIELFAGVGGFRVGLNDVQGMDENGVAIENRDWEFVWANQWEPSTIVQHAFECYETRFKDSSINSNEDISLVDKTTIPDHTLVVGGFPCQDYSVARSLSGEKGIEGKKGVLFWEIAEVLKTKKSPFLLLENVDRLLKSPSTQRGRDFGIMLRTFNDLGYNIEWRVVNAAEYGCAQRRRRTFIFGWKKSLKYNVHVLRDGATKLLFDTGLFASTFPIYKQTKDNKKMRDYNLLAYKDTVEMTESFKAQFGNAGIMINGIVYTIDSLPVVQEPITLRQIRDTRTNLNTYFLTDAQDIKFRELRASKKKERYKPNGEMYYYSEGAMCYPDNLDLPGRTMLTSEASINRSTHVIEDLETGKYRFLTPIEAERLQHFPDDWTNTGMPEKRRYFMMGNALVTMVINKLEKLLSEIVCSE